MDSCRQLYEFQIRLIFHLNKMNLNIIKTQSCIILCWFIYFMYLRGKGEEGWSKYEVPAVSDIFMKEQVTPFN